MEPMTVLIIVAAVVLVALVAAAVFLFLQKRSIEQSAVERADELVAAALNQPSTGNSVATLNVETETRAEMAQAA